MSNAKRLHPIAAFLNFLKELKGMILPVVALLFIRDGEKNDIWSYLPVIGLGAVILFVLISGIVKWLRFTYQLADGELKIEYGFFIKKKRYIPIERIQSLSFSESVLHRLFGLVKIKVETAGAGDESESEAELTAVTKAEGQAIQQVVNREKKRNSQTASENSRFEQIEDREEDSVIYQAKYSDLLLLAATSGGVGVVISALFAFLAQFQDVLPYERIFKEASHVIEMGALVIAVAVFFILFAAWIVSIGLTLLKYGGFTLEKAEAQLVIQKGLLEKRQLTIPTDRIQGVTIVENPLRQALGYCSVHLESAGGAAEEQGRASMVIMPMVKKKKAVIMLAEIFPVYCFSAQLSPVPRRAAGRYIVRACLYTALPAAAVVWLFWPFGLWGLTVFLPAAAYGFACFKAAGWDVRSDQLTVRTRKLSLQTAFMLKNRIQSFELTKTWRQGRKKLATVHSVIRSGAAGKKMKVTDTSAADAEKIYSWYKSTEERNNK